MLSSQSLATIIMAAGKGTRMRSNLPKVLHQVNQEPMIDHVIKAANTIKSNRIVVVVGHQRNRVIEHLEEVFIDLEYATQDPQLGTAHAVMVTEPLLGPKSFNGLVLILSGDVPLIRPETLQRMIEEHQQDSDRVATAMVTNLQNSKGYGRIVRTHNGTLSNIIEQKDIQSPEVESIREVNCGVYLFESQALFATLPQVDNKNQQQEYYLPQVLELMIANQQKVGLYTSDDPEETQGVNTPEQLESVERILSQR